MQGVNVSGNLERVTYSANGENNVSDIFILSLVAKNKQTFEFGITIKYGLLN